jgi:hypothetical protein
MVFGCLFFPQVNTWEKRKARKTQHVISVASWNRIFLAEKTFCVRIVQKSVVEVFVHVDVSVSRKRENRE